MHPAATVTFMKESENPYASDDDRILEIEQRRNLEREKRSLHAKAVRKPLPTGFTEHQILRLLRTVF